MSSQTSTPPQFRIPAPQSPAPVSVARAPRPGRATYLRRRLLVALGALVLALLLVLSTNAIQAEAGGVAPATAGHVVVQPGQTLWDIAADHMPAGTDLRGYLLALQQLNGIQTDAVEAWDVLLLPIIR